MVEGLTPETSSAVDCGCNLCLRSTIVGTTQLYATRAYMAVPKALVSARFVSMLDYSEDLENEMC